MFEYSFEEINGKGNNSGDRRTGKNSSLSKFYKQVAEIVTEKANNGWELDKQDIHLSQTGYIDEVHFHGFLTFKRPVKNVETDITSG